MRPPADLQAEAIYGRLRGEGQPMINVTNVKAALLVLVAFILVACGSPSVPDVAGQTFEEASDELEAAGYEVEREDVPEDDAEIGTVVRTEPPAGENLEEGEKVTVEVAARNIKGTITISGNDRAVARGDEGNCNGVGGYSDMRTGTTVVVRDGTGSTLATGYLFNGEVDEEKSTRGDGYQPKTVCVLPFGVVGVPRSDFYEIEIGRRGGLTYSLAEMEAQDWEVTSSLN